MKHFMLTIRPAALLAVALLLHRAAGPLRAQQPPPAPAPKGGAATTANLNRPAPPGKVAGPVAFTSKEGKKGWKVVIPGRRPLATPAVVDGKVFLGGGFGSHEFYAFDAHTGKQLWQYQTGDDGPTAAVVEDGCIAFNTESCELEVLSLDGKRLWKKWLGDPLMSMPALARGKVYMAYPNSKGDRKHYLACFDLKTGREHWKKAIAGEIITAPVIADSRIYLATLEGTVYCFGRDDGALVWSDKKNATSSPAVSNGQVYFSRRDVTIMRQDGKDVRQQLECLSYRDVQPAGKVKDVPATQRPADYLDFGKRGTLSNQEKDNQKNDSSVGFGAGAPDAKLSQAMNNLGQGSVAGVWSYQGSRPFVANGRLYTAMGDTVKCIDPRTQTVLWKRPVRAKEDKGLLVDSAVTPPAVVNGKLFVGTTRGEVLCLAAASGQVLWTATLGEPVQFQPAVVGGRVYVSTSTGSLFCLETGDPRDDGWRMWGGNAGHNGLAERVMSAK
jgi:Ca-activated chloride channel family protein